VGLGDSAAQAGEVTGEIMAAQAIKTIARASSQRSGRFSLFGLPMPLL
jgi:hypothetical protein